MVLSNRRRVTLGLVTSAVAVAGLMVAVFERQVGAPSPVTAEARGPRIEVPYPDSIQVSRRSQSRLDSELPAHPLDFGRLFNQAQDYLTFVRLAQTAAETGDADAQFYLSEALSFCAAATADASYGIYFVNSGGRLVIGRAVSQEGALRSEEVMSEIENHCGALHHAIENGERFGAANDWLSKAADNGSVPAQSTMALQALHDLSAVPVDSSFGLQLRTGDDARSLLVDVAADADPVALWNLGAAQGQFEQSYEDRLVNQLALWLVSCRSGLDCGAGALWVQLACQAVACPQNVSGLDLIASLSGDSREKVEKRAQVLGEALQTGTFAQVSFPEVSGADVPER